MIFSMGVREFVWVLCNQVNVFYDFRKSFTQHSDKVQLEENSKATAKKKCCYSTSSRSRDKQRGTGRSQIYGGKPP